MPLSTARAIPFLLLVSLRLATAQTTLLPAAAPWVENQGFCQNCAFSQPAWPEGMPPGLRVWGSYNPSPNQQAARAVTAPFLAPPHLRLYFSGTALLKGITIAVEKLSDHATLRLAPIASPGQAWLPSDFTLPDSWRGLPVRLVVEDNDLGPFAWLGVSEPLRVTTTPLGISDAVRLILLASLDLVLLMLPALALCALAVYKGVRDVVVAGLVLLAGTAPAGYLLFWLWFASPRSGKLLSTLIPVAAALCLILTLRKLDRDGRRVMKALVAPVLLIGVMSLLVLSTGFLYAGMRNPLRLAAQRFSHELPEDNNLPFVFAENLRIGHIDKPMAGDWLSSDRPPLQTGIVLSQYPFNPKPRVMGYLVLSVILQSLWVLAVWLLLCAFGVNRRAAVLALAVCFFSGFVFLNTFYVWPKLLSASYLIGLITILFTRRISPLLATTGGALLAFALLAHGGSLFAAIGVVLTLLLFRKPIPLKSLGILAATAVLLYLPWVGYQKLYDPPANRLLKWHLAGVIPVDTRTFPEALSQQYNQLSLQQILQQKLLHIARLTGHELDYLQTALHWDSPAQTAFQLRHFAFYDLSPNLGLLILGPVALLIGIPKQHRSPEWRAAALLWTFVALTALAWSLLMFTDQMVIHEGTYVIILLAYAASVLAFWAVSPWLAVTVATLQISLQALLYVALMRQPTQSIPLLEGILQPALLALALLLLAPVILLLARLKPS